ncbi:MAG: ribulose-phosphate 3-epimerase [Opitutaceae bacterium]|nr:ribulose-phosphate 3-epimerase [Opitutaceae bacterium]
MPPTQDIILAPSLLAGDHAALSKSAQTVEEAGLKWIHLDIMDGHFVPNLSFGPESVKALRRTSSLFFDTHLMLDNPHLYVEAFAKAGSDLISIHVEPNYDISATLNTIRSHNCQTGIVLNPGTPVSAIEGYIAQVDLVLVMTVQPGFGGQKFQTEMLSKMETIHKWRREHDLQFRLEVDGGIDLQTAPLCKEKGVDTFVAGTAFFKATDKKTFIEEIQQSPSN